MKATKEQIDRAQSIIEAHAITSQHVVEEALNAALALLQSSAPEWETIETAPRPPATYRGAEAAPDVLLGRWVDLNGIPRWQTRVAHWGPFSGRWVDGHGSDFIGATHWMPIAPPGSLASHPAASPELIAQLEAVAGLAEKATAGPWDNDSGLIGTYITGRRDWSHVASVIAGELESAESDANAAFIVAVRSLPFAEIVVALKALSALPPIDEKPEAQASPLLSSQEEGPMGEPL